MAHAHDDEDFGAILAAFEEEQAREPRKEPRVGDKVTGTIASIGEEFAFVDVGAKSEGIVDRAELVDDDGRLTVDVGDRVTGLVGSIDATGAPVLRVRPGRGEAMRAELRLAWEQKLPVEGLVSGVVKGGLEVTVAGMRAFCPISQIADRYIEDPSEFVDRRLEFRIERFEEAGRRTNVVLSRRALLEEEAARKAEELRQKIEVGAIFQGKVSSVTSYGAFVDLGGLEGLLHVSEMSYERVDDPHELVKEGEQIEVQVLKVELAKKPGERERISLSTRALTRDPWKDVEERFPPGAVFEGRVMRLEPYGAFIQLTPGVEGLAHISKLGGEEHLRHAREVLELGQTVRVKVLAVEPDKRRISLSREKDAREVRADREVEAYLDKQPRAEGFGSLGDFFKKRDD